MKSRFKFGAYITTIFAIIFTGMLCLALLSIYLLGNVIPLFLYLILNLYFIFIWIWIVFGELRKKVIYLDMGYDSFNVKGYLGLGTPIVHYFNDLNGYKTAILPAKGASYEFLYLMAGDKKVIKLSQFYHKNYDELKEAILSSHFKDLGYEEFSYVRELKEIFV